MNQPRQGILAAGNFIVDFVKLIDAYPEHYPENWDLAGYQLMVSNEVFSRLLLCDVQHDLSAL